MKNNFKYKIAFGAVFFGLSGAVFAQTEDQITDFTKAAKFDDASEVQSLLSKGVSPNTKDPKGNPMLFVAIREKSYKVTDLLIASKSIDVNLTNKSGETPLMIASIDGELEVDKLLVQKGAEVNRIGWTPLHWAAEDGHKAVAALLLANKAYVNAKERFDYTPLHWAARRGYKDVVELHR